MNDLLNAMTDTICQPDLFVDDIDMRVSHPSPTQFINDINKVFVNINDWLKINLLSLNVNKVYYLQFRTRNVQKLT